MCDARFTGAPLPELKPTHSTTTTDIGPIWIGTVVTTKTRKLSPAVMFTTHESPCV